MLKLWFNRVAIAKSFSNSEQWVLAFKFEDVKQDLFYIIKYYFIYFANSFYNFSSYFTHNSIK